MTPEQFAQYASEGFNRIPLAKEVLADLDTPLTAYLKLANKPYTFLLESVQGGEKWGRYSFIGLSCHTRLQACGQKVEVIKDQSVVETKEMVDPLVFVEEFIQRFRVPIVPDLPSFTGGLVGYFGYDTVRYVEKRLKNIPEDQIKTPDILLLLTEDLLVFDNYSGKITLVTLVDPTETNAYDKAKVHLDQLIGKLRHETIAPEMETGSQAFTENNIDYQFSQDDFEKAIDEVKEYILAGDVMQVVLSQRMSMPYAGDTLNIYRALRYLNPSPYLYYLNMDDFQIIGSSPEILVKVEGQQVDVRPIAGTRRRGYTEAEDLALEKELLADPKEIAEHLMLIDLGRNDVGRIAKSGSVQLTEKMIIERYSHVMHIVSNVIGELKSDLTAMDVLRATLPAGTLSGAPKVRAMEIIDQLEPVKRGIYGGAVGFLSWHDDLNVAIAIRTAVVKDKILYLQAGAGVVADSIPAHEWKETLNKGRAMLRAVQMAERDLQLKKG